MENNRNVNNSCQYRNQYPQSSMHMNCNVTKQCRIDEPVGMGYVPWQVWGKVYDSCKGLCRGTIFPELDKPFEGGGCK